MDYLVLENTTLKVSRLCMGGCPMGGYGWGSVREDELLAAIHAALDVGVNFFDTADIQRRIDENTTAAFFARMLAHQCTCRREWIVFADKFDSVGIAPLANKGNVPRHVNVSRA